MDWNYKINIIDGLVIKNDVKDGLKFNLKS